MSKPVFVGVGYAFAGVLMGFVAAAIVFYALVLINPVFGFFLLGGQILAPLIHAIRTRRSDYQAVAWDVGFASAGLGILVIVISNVLQYR